MYPIVYGQLEVLKQSFIYCVFLLIFVQCDHTFNLEMEVQECRSVIDNPPMPNNVCVIFDWFERRDPSYDELKRSYQIRSVENKEISIYNENLTNKNYQKVMLTFFFYNTTQTQTACEKLSLRSSCTIEDQCEARIQFLFTLDEQGRANVDQKHGVVSDNTICNVEY